MSAPRTDPSTAGSANDSTTPSTESAAIPPSADAAASPGGSAGAPSTPAIPEPVKAAAQSAAQTAAQVAQSATQTAAQAAQSASQTAAQAAQTATQAAQNAADAQTVFEVERERELHREARQAPPTTAVVAEKSAEALTRGELREAVRAKRRLPIDIERKIGLVARLDARLFLLINGLPRTRPMNQFMVALAIVTNAGAAWIATLGAMALANHSREARNAFLAAAPVVSGTAWAVEGPIKGRVRRKRPFMTLEEAVVVGGKPKNWSWPSGHTASAFAAAAIAARDFPQSSLPLYLFATLVGWSRVYLGAHFPSDVISGAAIGTVAGLALPPILRRLAPRLFCADGRSWWRRFW